MNVKCIANTGEYLLEKSVETGELRATKYPVDIGEVYTVYCMSTWKGCLDYLLSGEDARFSFWYPAELFEVVNPLLPLEWYFTFRTYGGEVREAIWGYKEMVSDSKHLVYLIEREQEVVEIFLKRKKSLMSTKN